MIRSKTLNGSDAVIHNSWSCSNGCYGRTQLNNNSPSVPDRWCSVETCSISHRSCTTLRLANSPLYENTQTAREAWYIDDSIGRLALYLSFHSGETWSCQHECQCRSESFNSGNTDLSIDGFNVYYSLL